VLFVKGKLRRPQGLAGQKGRAAGVMTPWGRSWKNFQYAKEKKMQIVYFKGKNLTKYIVSRKIKKWVGRLDDRHLSRLCDCINEIDIEIADRENLINYFTGPRLNIMRAKKNFSGIPSLGDFFRK
jgi:hypothetical protein